MSSYNYSYSHMCQFMSNAIIRISRGTKLSWKLTITRMHICVITAPGRRLWRLFMITEKRKLFLSFYVSSVDEQCHHEIFPKRYHQVFAAHPASFSESNSTGSCCEFSNATCQCLTDKAGTACLKYCASPYCTTHQNKCRWKKDP